MHRLLIIISLLGACSSSQPVPTEVGEVTFTELRPNVWMHTSTKVIGEYGPVPSNGLIVLTPTATVLVDTAWDDAQTGEVLAWAKARQTPITHAVFTHAHDDKMGGVAAVRAAGVATFAAADSNAFAAERGMTPAETALTFGDDNLSAELPGVVVFDPGPGHTVDNIVVGLPAEGIVFGGCLVRPPGTDNLGNTADADVAHWDDAVQAVADQFPAAQVVVPSHGPPAGRELFDLTISLARAAQPG